MQPARNITRLAALHLLANVLVLWLGYYWLGIGESRTATLLWSGLVALLLISFTCWVYAIPLVFFRNRGDTDMVAWRTALYHLLPIAAAGIGLISIYWLLGRWTDSSPKSSLQALSFRIASWLTLTVRRPVKPASVLLLCNVLFWLIRWMVLPVLLLPAASAIAARGWSGYRAIGARSREWRYWICVPLLLVCFLWLPLWLIRWVPHVEGFWIQAASFTLRAIVAYLLFGIAWLVLAFITSGGKPALTQPRTVGPP